MPVNKTHKQKKVETQINKKSKKTFEENKNLKKKLEQTIIG